MIISCYGLHRTGGIPFLVQARQTTNLISNELVSPFVPHIRPRRMRCPHEIDLHTYQEAPAWLQDPLAQALLPGVRAPGEVAKVIYDPKRETETLITQLCRMSSPTEPLTRPLWWRLADELRGLYGVTNLTPLVWTAAEAQHGKQLYRHLELAEAFGRRILIVARERLPIFQDIEWIETGLTDVSAEPLEAIGSGVVRAVMNGH